MVAEFVDERSGVYTLSFARSLEGPRDEYGYLPDYGGIFISKDERFILSAAQVKEGVLFLVDVFEKNGKRAELESVMESKGHLYLVDQNNSFYHLTAQEHTDDPIPAAVQLFYVSGLPKGKYRIYAEFKTNGVMLSPQFDWKIDAVQ